MLFNEPKLLKFQKFRHRVQRLLCFSALQRAEIAETTVDELVRRISFSFSALQRAEIAEMMRVNRVAQQRRRFSALQRAEIAET